MVRIQLYCLKHIHIRDKTKVSIRPLNVLRLLTALIHKIAISFTQIDDIVCMFIKMAI